MLTAPTLLHSRAEPRAAPSAQWGARPQVAESREEVSHAQGRGMAQRRTRSAVQGHRAWVRFWHGRSEAPGWTPTCALTGMPSDPGAVTSASGGGHPRRPSPASRGWRPRSALHVRCPEPSVGSCDQPGAHNLPSLPRKHSREAAVSESSCQSGFYLFLHILFCC